MAADVSGSFPGDAECERRVREGFAGQAFMQLLGAQLDVVEPGRVAIRVEHHATLDQQHGFVHAGVLATLADTASGFAALSIVGTDRDILTAEFKINLLRPAAGTHFVADAHVVRAGRNLVVCRADVTDHRLTAIATVTLSTISR